MNKTILIVDDEKDILDLLSYNLSKNKYNVVTANNGHEALLKIDSSIDLVILDVMMPKLDGYQVCDVIKSNPQLSEIPIIFLTAKSSSDDEYAGLSRGAVDYIYKPISIKNLLIRIDNILKTFVVNDNKDILSYYNLSINLEKAQVLLEKNKINLTNKEYNLLLLFMKSPGRVFNREELLNKVWGHNVIVSDRTIDVHITNLRKKIEKNKKIIYTSHGRGYYIEDE